ncbi:MAG: tRNA 5-methoxyuridine(34)/uridine 5-oxyacetic acid(34) synthase CmoB [Gammaproteobacteria bacterium]|nr:tRNA 5-methoxyuridine(34)/uridine 5-oxyacetic acid(34) synthase CmoB [Gammaproteobacteria bacterium]MDH4255056.1 tRNA 5-methoxyuridine(34)/uridine 5-oxyacetic acid(34) synthase CmoB [Gammaproteobacteria bacterium]MDH5310944.1 tRNA 5-methoxyuridine(34)/uridine 5-oxyacetic acid(34) synthase CmoB [Gammaproteobacteria bacterium]
MLDLGRIRCDLDKNGLGSWADALLPAAAARLAAGAHGDLPAWQDALAALPGAPPVRGVLDGDAVGAPVIAFDAAARDRAREALLRLAPWRKGPFRLGSLSIDSEWRSNLKWDRVAASIRPVAGRTVLDVGSGNGYYALRLRGAGARLVLGVDPTLLYVVQFLAITRYLEPEPVHVLPLRLEELPGPVPAFDTVLSMGVLYHQRSPLDHLHRLREALRPGGELVLETLVLPGDEALARTPADRYARMRNVWLLPTVPELLVWLARSGFRDTRVADLAVTTTGEQRRSDWMPFESLAEALDPADPSRTVEGWPAPRRALLLATRPG